MKKNILFCFCLLVSVASFAQQIHYGVGGGVTFYNMRGAAAGNLSQVLSFTDGIVSTGPVTGLYGGGYANIPISNHLSVEPGIYYATKGYAITGTYAVKGIAILSANASASLHSAYIEIPLLLRADFNGLQVFAGPQLSYLARASVKTKAGLTGINIYQGSINVTNQLNRWDAALTGGIGYQFSNGIRITASYDRGLTSVDAGQNIKSYNQGFKIGAGMSF